MPQNAPDKVLRGLVAELATTTPEDVAAILAMLDAGAAARLRALLAAYADFEGIYDLDAGEPKVDTTGLSDWLAARTLGRPLTGTDGYHVTPHVAGALREIALTMPPLEAVRPQMRSLPTGREVPRSHRFQSLFGKGADA